jgi:signal peptidase
MGYATVTSIPCTSAAFAKLAVTILRAGRAVQFRARGTSMSPLVRDGDIVLVRPLNPRRARLGDVVLFTDGPGHVFLHRVVRKRRSRAGIGFTVQGDRLSQPDGVIPEAQVHGLVMAIDRQGVRIAVHGSLARMLGWSMVVRSR